MKKITYLLMISGLFFLNISCSDFLKENRKDAVTNDAIYSSAEGLESGVIALYNIQRSNKWAREDNGLFLYCATDLALVRTYNDKQIYGTQYNPLSFPATFWETNYQLIDRANAIITNAPKVNMNADQRNTIIAQAKFFRAEAHFDLIRLYQNILLDTIATTTDNAFEKKEYQPADPNEIFKLIDGDLDFAISHLSYGVAPGRVNQGAARMLKANSAMWQKKWEEAATQCDNIITNGPYGLVNISEVFGQNINHKETIFSYQYDQLAGGAGRLAGGSPHALAAYFVNRYYEATTELVADADLGGQTYAWTLPNDYLKSLYATNDKRLQYYFWPQTYDKSYIVNNPVSPNFGQLLAQNKYPDNYRQYHWSLKKYFDLEKPVGTGQGYKNVIIYRLAETYLLGAEAHWRSSGNSADPTALNYIGKVRERAGIPNVTSIDQQTILDERARELCFEMERWFTLKRMGILVDQVNKYLMVGSNSKNVVHRTMEPYMVNLPIPQSQIDLMGTFPQNPGY